jgi:hypothetical protein
MKSRAIIFTTILSAAACFGLSPRTQAVVPPPDGGYLRFNTAEDQKAPFSLTTGTGNVAVGWDSLYSDAEGSLNTGVGAGALVLNTNDNNTAVGAVALLLNTTGTDNTAVGTDALALNTSAFTNVAAGTFAAENNDSSGMEPPISTRLWAPFRSRLTLMAPKTPPLVLARWSLETKKARQQKTEPSDCVVSKRNEERR